MLFKPVPAVAVNDLRHAIAGLRKAPALAAIAIVSLGLGIGPNVTVFSVAREMIFDDVTAGITPISWNLH